MGFQKVFWLAQKWLILFVFAALIKMLCCSLMQWTRTWHTKTWSRRSFATQSKKCIMHCCESCRGTATLKEFLDQELSKHEDDEKFSYCHWDTTNRAIFTTFTATYDEYKETLIDVIDDLTRHSYIAKLKVASSWYRTKSKCTTGVKNTPSYIPWLYTTWDQMVASNVIQLLTIDTKRLWLILSMI